MITRRHILFSGLAAVLVSSGRSAFGQNAAGRTPRNETDWARLGVSLKGRTALVTGSTDGLGVELARQLGALGAFVIVHGRNAERGEEVVRKIQTAGPGDAAFYRADLASLAEVRSLAAQVRARHKRLDLLINNAAARNPGDRRVSTDGHEFVLAVNYLSHFLLTRELLPLLEAGAPARIVNVSSIAQSPIDFTDIPMERGKFNYFQAYGRSKLAQIMFTIDLAARLDPSKVTVTSLHPARSMNTPRVTLLGAEVASSVEEGAEAVMNLAVSPETKSKTGVYFNQLTEARANAQAYDAEARAKLWALSEQLTR